MKEQFRPALTLLLAFTLLTGLVYPLAITLVAQVFFPVQANGSLISVGGTVYGSDLIGQPFSQPSYFWGRPSAAGYNAAASTGSNLGPANPVLLEGVQAQVHLLRVADPENTNPIPVDLVTSSASGLDPHISVAAALYQAPRVARARGLTEAEVVNLIMAHVDGREWGILGEPRVNVLSLNLALDGIQ